MSRPAGRQLPPAVVLKSKGGNVELSSTVRTFVVLSPGTAAPAFSLPDQDGIDVSLADQTGHWVLLWWYPKAATPG